MSVQTITRFPTGLSHAVYEVATADERHFVVRVARPERNSELERGLYWHAQLERLHVPLPQIYASGHIDGRAYAVYERLPGTDLEIGYHTLTAPQRKRIAECIAGIQRQVQGLGAEHFQDAPPWPRMIEKILLRTERELGQKGDNANPYLAALEGQFVQRRSELGSRRPVAFLYDLNVRNAIVNNGRLTGIIDVDEVWYGDPLLAIGRGKTLLMLMQAETDFVTFWCDAWDLPAEERRLVDFYALLYAVRFMGTLGQVLNGNPSVQTDPEKAELLVTIAERLLSSLYGATPPPTDTPPQQTYPTGG